MQFAIICKKKGRENIYAIDFIQENSRSTYKKPVIQIASSKNFRAVEQGGRRLVYLLYFLNFESCEYVTCSK